MGPPYWRTSPSPLFVLTLSVPFRADGIWESLRKKPGPEWVMGPGHGGCVHVRGRGRGNEMFLEGTIREGALERLFS